MAGTLGCTASSSPSHFLFKVPDTDRNEILWKKKKNLARRGNMLAHALIRRAISSVDYDVWVEKLRSDLKIVFQNGFI